MTELVDQAEIERIVGAHRHPHLHAARAITAEQRVYILHSQTCLDSGADLRECRVSIALDLGITPDMWAESYDIPVVVGLAPNGRLIPLEPVATWPRWPTQPTTPHPRPA